MIVRYIKERGFAGKGPDPSVTIGKEYQILMVSTRQSSEGNEVMFSILRDSDQQLVMFNASFFTIVDHRIPPNWVYESDDNGRYAIYPEEFDDDFLAKLADGEDLQGVIFSGVVKKLNAFHST